MTDKKNVRVSFGGKGDQTVPVKIVTNKGTVDTAATKQLAKNNSALTSALMARERGITSGISWLVSQIAGDSKALGNPKRAYTIAKKIAPETIAEEKRRKRKEKTTYQTRLEEKRKATAKREADTRTAYQTRLEERRQERLEASRTGAAGKMLQERLSGGLTPDQLADGPPRTPKQKGGKVVKKTSTVKRSSNGKAKQPVKKTARKTKKTTRRSKR